LGYFSKHFPALSGLIVLDFIESVSLMLMDSLSSLSGAFMRLASFSRLLKRWYGA